MGFVIQWAGFGLSGRGLWFNGRATNILVLFMKVRITPRSTAPLVTSGWRHRRSLKMKPRPHLFPLSTSATLILKLSLRFSRLHGAP